MPRELTAPDDAGRLQLFLPQRLAQIRVEQDGEEERTPPPSRLTKPEGPASSVGAFVRVQVVLSEGGEIALPFLRTYESCGTGILYHEQEELPGSLRLFQGGLQKTAMTLWNIGRGTKVAKEAIPLDGLPELLERLPAPTDDSENHFRTPPENLVEYILDRLADQVLNLRVELFDARIAVVLAPVRMLAAQAPVGLRPIPLPLAGEVDVGPLSLPIEKPSRIDTKKTGELIKNFAARHL